MPCEVLPKPVHVGAGRFHEHNEPGVVLGASGLQGDGHEVLRRHDPGGEAAVRAADRLAHRFGYEGLGGGKELHGPPFDPATYGAMVGGATQLVQLILLQFSGSGLNSNSTNESVQILR